MYNASGTTGTGTWTGSYGSASTSLFTSATWTHVAIQFTSSTKLLECYVGGTRQITQTLANVVPSSAFNYVRLGNYSPDQNTYQLYNAYIDELRFSNSIRYTSGSTITIPTSTFTTDSSTQYLNSWNFGSASGLDWDYSQTTPSQIVGSANSLTYIPSDSIIISSSYYKFGTGALYFPTTGYYSSLTVNGLTTSNFSGNWTIEFWTYLANSPVYNSSTVQPFFVLANGTSSGNLMYLSCWITSNVNQIVLAYNASGTTGSSNTWSTYSGSSTSLFTSSSWTHVAIQFTSSTKLLECYVGGSRQISQTLASAIPSTAFSYVRLGSHGIDLSGNQLYNVFIDEMRISNTTRYTSGTTITTPTSCFITDSSTQFLNSFNFGAANGYEWDYAQTTPTYNKGRSLLHLDSTYNRMGINNTNPQYALDVIGDINTSSKLSAYAIACSGALSSASLTISGQTTLNQVAETIYNAGAQVSNSISLAWTNGANFYLTPYSSTNFTVNITNVPIATYTGTYSFNLIMNTSTNKSYCSTLTVNGSSTSLYYNGGSSSVTISSATYVVQNFVLIYVGSTSPTLVITSISPFY